MLVIIHQTKDMVNKKSCFLLGRNEEVKRKKNECVFLLREEFEVKSKILTYLSGKIHLIFLILRGIISSSILYGERFRC